MKSKRYSDADKLPDGRASENIAQGCLVLEGGALRGVYTSGVLDAMMEAGINLECTVGVSAGALNGLYYTAGQIGLAARCNLLHRHDSRYVSFMKKKQYGGIFCFDYILNRVSDLPPLDWSRLYQTEKKFFAAATSLLTGESVYFDKDHCDDLLHAVQASASMPYLSEIITVEGIPCLDGGCSAKVPYRFAFDHGFKKIVVVRTRPSEWRYADEKDDTKAHLFYRKYPQFVEKLKSSKARYNRDCDDLAGLEEDGEIFVIAPSKMIPIKRLESDVNKLAELYYLGYEDGKTRMPQLESYLRES